MENQAKFMVLSAIGTPIMRKGDEANPYIFYTLRHAFQFAEEEMKNQEAVSIVEIKEVETLCSSL